MGAAERIGKLGWGPEELRCGHALLGGAGAGWPSWAWGWKGDGSSWEPWVLWSFSASQSISCGGQGLGQGPQHSLPEPPAMLSTSLTWTEVEEGPAGTLTVYETPRNSNCLHPALSLCLRPNKPSLGKTWFLSQLGEAVRELNLKA